MNIRTMNRRVAVMSAGLVRGATAPASIRAASLPRANIVLQSLRSVAAHKNVQPRAPKAFADAAANKTLTGPGGKPFGPIGST